LPDRSHIGTVAGNPVPSVNFCEEDGQKPLNFPRLLPLTLKRFREKAEPILPCILELLSIASIGWLPLIPAPKMRSLSLRAESSIHYKTARTVLLA
jgi:hypothetical protein